MNEESINEEKTPMKQLVVFRLQDQLYAVNIISLQEIIPLGEITRVPRTPPYVKGIINLRGKIIPVLDMKRFFSFSGETTLWGKEMIVIIQEKGNALGLIVDAVTQIRWMAQSSFETAPDMGEETDAVFISGAYPLDDEKIMLLDTEKFIWTVQKENI